MSFFIYSFESCLPTPQISEILNFLSSSFIFISLSKTITPVLFFLAIWFATLLNVLVLAIPMLVGIPVHFKILSLISFPYSLSL
jgi:hypothetical protein